MFILCKFTTSAPLLCYCISSSLSLMFCSIFFCSSLLQRAADGELDPEDDPNNQGEDEFEEAEDERLQHRVTQEEEEAEEEVEEEPAAPAQHVDTHKGPNQPAVEEELVVSKGPENSNSRLQRSYI